MKSLSSFISEKLIIKNVISKKYNINEIKNIYSSIKLEDIDSYYNDTEIPQLYDSRRGGQLTSIIGTTYTHWFKFWMVLTVTGEIDLDLMFNAIGDIYVENLSKQKVINYNSETNIISANPISKWETEFK